MVQRAHSYDKKNIDTGILEIIRSMLIGLTIENLIFESEKLTNTQKINEFIITN